MVQIYEIISGKQQYENPDEGIGDIHCAVVENPGEALPQLLELDTYGIDSLEISKTRGFVPVYVDHANNGLPLESSSVTLVCNAGAFNHNSHTYSRMRHDEDARAAIELDEQGDGPLIYGYSQPQDRMFIGTVNRSQTELVLSRIRESFATIGVELTEDIDLVPSIDGYIRENSAPTRVLPHVSDPHMMAWIGRRLGQEGNYLRTGMINSALYVKTEFQRQMEKNGVSTPDTHHTKLARSAARRHAKEIYERFSLYDRVIISDGSGVGGKSVFDVPREIVAIAEFLETVEFPEGTEVMSQGKLPWKVSPCVRANIGDDFIRLTGASVQRILDSGKHAGNISFKGISAYLGEMAPDFWMEHIKTLQVLQRLGVRGQINLDSMVITREDAEKLGLTSQTFLREVNVRPAVSAVINAIQRGRIDGKPVDKILLNSKVAIPPEVFKDPRFMQILQRFNTPETRAILLNYDDDPKLCNALIAFAGTLESEIDTLALQEYNVKEAIKELAHHFS